MEMAGRNSITGGHMGVKKITDKILNAFYWPGIQEDVARHCNSCNVLEFQYKFLVIWTHSLCLIA